MLRSVCRNTFLPSPPTGATLRHRLRPAHFASAIQFLPIAVEALRTRLGQEAFEAALAEGRSLSFPQMATLIGDVLDAAAQVDAYEKATYEEGSTILGPTPRQMSGAL